MIRMTQPRCSNFLTAKDFREAPRGVKLNLLRLSLARLLPSPARIDASQNLHRASANLRHPNYSIRSSHESGSRTAPYFEQFAIKRQQPMLPASSENDHRLPGHPLSTSGKDRFDE